MSARRESVVLQPEAQLDLESIAQYTGQHWGTSQRNAYVRAISRALTQLGENPRLGRLQEDVGRNVRALRVQQHIIYYRLHADTVMVLRILHGKMDAALHIDES